MMLFLYGYVKIINKIKVKSFASCFLLSMKYFSTVHESCSEQCPALILRDFKKKNREDVSNFYTGIVKYTVGRSNHEYLF